MMTRRQMMRSVFYSLPPVAATAKMAVAYGGDSLEFEVVEVEVPIQGLPDRLKGLSFVQISDLHLGLKFNTLDAQELRAAKEVIEDLHPDFVLLTGDIMDRMPFELREETRILSSIRSRHGTFGILGNHEHYAGAPTIYHGLVKAGVDMLVNEHRILKVRDEELALIGVDTPASAFGSGAFLERVIRKTVDGVGRVDLPRILMSHHPNGFYYANPRGVDLTISGHTHGGQVVFGEFGDFRLSPAQLVFKYLKGHYRRDHTHLYVNAGLGHWMPLRHNCAPEITRFTLV
ncbi:MAG: metallophosphoesterase [Myxococcales bacterium]|nr:metallophosphoesterase [Myxococcales bacterium]